MPKMIQKLYDTCKQVFANGGPGYVPPPEDVQRIRSVLDSLKPVNVGLSPEMAYFKIGIFCLPPSAVIPLHNHPQMTVFSKLLIGNMHIKSYDWVADQPNGTSPQPGRRLAKICNDSTFTAPCDTSILYPTSGGNMHCFTAMTSCAVLDVLGPPYDDANGRHCAYYNDIPYLNNPGDGELLPDEDEEKFAWLEEIDQPESFVVVGATYRGPRIMVL